MQTKARNRRFLRCSGRSNFYWHKLDGQRVFKSQAMLDPSFEAGQSNDGTAGQLTASSHGIWYMYDQRGNLAMQGQTSAVDNGFAEYEKATHYYWLPNEFGDILVAFDQDGRSFAVYTDHINTPRLVTLVNNPLNPVPLTDTSNDLAQTSGDAIQGISPLAMPVWQMAYSPFGVDLANGYEARPTTINNNFKPDLWEWLGLPETGGAGNWSWYAGGGNGQVNGSVLTAPVLNIRYPGQYYDFESGLSQNWWRSYDARMGRYTQNDPIGLGGGMNRFNYVDGDAVSGFDPKGLAAEHTKNARPSTQEKHQKDQAAKQQSRGGEKGDFSRGVPRTRPPGYKGSWPPQTTQRGFVLPEVLSRCLLAAALLLTPGNINQCDSPCDCGEVCDGN